MGGCGLVNLAQDKNKWLAFVNTVMTFGFHEIRGIS